MMPSYFGALVALAFLSMVGYLFWRGVIVVTNAREHVKAGALLVDVGTPEEFEAAHIAGATNIPAAELSLRRREMGSARREIVVYARTAFRSATATHVLRSLGYRTVINAGPMRRWDAGPDVGLTGRWVGDPPPSIRATAPHATAPRG